MKRDSRSQNSEKSSKDSASRRVIRMEKEVRQVVSHWLIRGVDGIEALTTVTRVQMPGDLKSAKVYVTWLKSDLSNKEILEKLNSKAYEVQHALAKELNVRFTPKIRFYFDDGAEKIIKIESILRELEVERRKNKTSDTNDGDDDNNSDNNSGDSL